MRVGLKSISSVILGLAILAGTATVPVFAAGSNDDTGNTKEPVSGRVNSLAAPQCPIDDQGNCYRPLCSAVANDRNCNNQDPIDQKCLGDPQKDPPEKLDYVVETAYIGSLGKVELRYAPKCQSNWTRVTSNQTASVYGKITRDDGVQYDFSYGGSLYTNMVYAPVRKAQACGTIDGQSACTNYR